MPEGPPLGSRVTIASAQIDMATGRKHGIVQSVIYGTTKDAIVLERCDHAHRTIRSALDCGRAMLRARARRARSK